jgi:hypothetical protein
LRIRSTSLLLRWLSLLFILLAAVVLVYQLIQYSLQRSNYPMDMTIGGVPVGGLDPQSAAQRLLTVFSLPVELHYGDAIITAWWLQPISSVQGLHFGVDSGTISGTALRFRISYLWFPRFQRNDYDHTYNRKLHPDTTNPPRLPNQFPEPWISLLVPPDRFWILIAP